RIEARGADRGGRADFRPHPGSCRRGGVRTGVAQRRFIVFVKLTEEQRRMVASVRALAQSEFKPRAIRYLDGTFPWDNMKRLAELGVLGMAVPEEYGGLGAT